MKFDKVTGNCPILITVGEPAGIGPNLCLQLADTLLQKNVVLCASIDSLKKRANELNIKVNFHNYFEGDSENSIPVVDIEGYVPIYPGELSLHNSHYVINMLKKAVNHVLNKDFSALVTGPIHKSIICDAGYANFIGHTEFIANEIKAKQPVMCLVSEALRVALMTTHVPLSDLPTLITQDKIKDVISTIDDDLKRLFNINKPKIGVCGLNPHAGEGGHLGREEIDTINPALLDLKAQGIDVSLAQPADTIFIQDNRKKYDIIVAMYHDQGLSVIKTESFGKCSNLTLGLPIIRTSVDHGTALDLASTTNASTDSLLFSIEIADQLAYEKNS